jgi:membrane protein
MARLTDIPKISRSIGMRVFLLRVYDEMYQDNLLVWASALAYSWLFAIFPFFIFLLALMPYLPQRVRIVSQTQVMAVMADQLPSAAGNIVRTAIDENGNNILHQRTLRGPTLYGALLVALWVASSGTSMTMSALDRCYEVEKGRSIYRQRIMAMLLTIFVAIMLLAVMCLLPVATMLKDWVVQQGDGPGRITLFIFDVARWLLSLVLMVLVLMVVYYNGPCIRHHFSFITPGAVFVIVVWVVLGLLFRLYVDHIGARGYGQTYGAVGGVALLLVFFYLDALVLLIGAEINAEVDFEVLRVRRGTNDFRKCEDFSCGAPTSC